MHTHNIDNCSRYCQAPATEGLRRTMGYGGDSSWIFRSGAGQPREIITGPSMGGIASRPLHAPSAGRTSCTGRRL